MIDYGLENTEIGQVLSIGDKIPCKSFGRIHSRFEHILNFILGEQIVSLVTPAVGAGPFRIVVEDVDLKTIHSVRLTDVELVLNHSIKLLRRTAPAFRSAWMPACYDAVGINKNIKLLKKALLDRDDDKSISFLLKQKKPAKQQSAFEQELFSQISKAYQKLEQNDVIGAVNGFRGRGYGLTPAGDDFNTGLLLGLTIRHKFEKKELANIRSSVYTNAVGKNLLVNTFLLQAYHGWYNDNWKNLLNALNGKTADLSAAVQDILAQGETSGADTLTGFVTAWDV
jgi:hypothetical protein